MSVTEFKATQSLDEPPPTDTHIHTPSVPPRTSTQAREGEGVGGERERSAFVVIGNKKIIYGDVGEMPSPRTGHTQEYCVEEIVSESLEGDFDGNGVSKESSVGVAHRESEETMRESISGGVDTANEIQMFSLSLGDVDSVKDQDKVAEVEERLMQRQRDTQVENEGENEVCVFVCVCMFVCVL